MVARLWLISGSGRLGLSQPEMAATSGLRPTEIWIGRAQIWGRSATDRRRRRRSGSCGCKGSAAMRNDTVAEVSRVREQPNPVGHDNGGDDLATTTNGDAGLKEAEQGWSGTRPRVAETVKNRVGGDRTWKNSGVVDPLESIRYGAQVLA
ncbi:uncharacterized protein M6B38_345825 [Iris pallida]|uniref:Uncharacterized protein n=1 Tax=Iris pallida TaxID=29817 RepID=A0AAX6GUE2_IRIPA|nr:uncharacterized protein M6B38_345825 [Iris pallida]